MKTLPICSTCKNSKTPVNGFLIVEGYSDMAFLSSFLEAKIVQIGGFSFSRRITDYILELATKSNPIVLMDQDEAGILNEKRLANLLPNATVIKVENIVGRNGKKGIAESNKNDILKALDHHLITKIEEEQNLTLSDLFASGLIGESSKYKRDLLTREYGLGECNAKTFLKRCNALKITKEDLERKMANNGN